MLLIILVVIAVIKLRIRFLPDTKSCVFMKTRGFYSLNAFNLHGVDLKSFLNINFPLRTHVKNVLSKIERRIIYLTNKTNTPES